MTHPRIVIATRSRNEDLYKKASAFWPTHIERRCMTGYDTYEGTVQYLRDILTIDAHLVINCDEDCFVFDWRFVDKLCEYMLENPAVLVAGMPDYFSDCHHRYNSAAVMNPFFNVFKPLGCREQLATGQWTSDEDVRLFSCKMNEPFNEHFIRLTTRQRGLRLRGRDHPDGLSTELKWEYSPFALHSWYSRSYDGAHKQRIDALHDEARSRCTLP